MTIFEARRVALQKRFLAADHRPPTPDRPPTSQPYLLRSQHTVDP